MNYNTFYFSFIPSLYSPLTAVHALATMQRRNIGALHSPLTTVPALATMRETCGSRFPWWASISSLAHDTQDSPAVHAPQSILT